MLVVFEGTIKKDKPVLLMGSSAKKGPRLKGKKHSAPAKEEKPTKKPKAKASKPNKTEDVCHHCHKPEHWRRNCKEYLEQLQTVGPWK
ncbi:Retrotransposon protein [Dorcoceras hygrometricum]|uniref:Retrotransposon protein n=1 Tax=Dorcoceras hygrometricum TaxID=472368 RepID=A0A2Z7A9Z1_9LAMI|nr:Retrotransposon protein [Dorcoceras hygrometricum]